MSALTPEQIKRCAEGAPPPGEYSEALTFLAASHLKLVEALRNARAGFVTSYLRGAEIANHEKRGSRAALVGLEMQKYAQSGQADVDALLRDLGDAQ